MYNLASQIQTIHSYEIPMETAYVSEIKFNEIIFPSVKCS